MRRCWVADCNHSIAQMMAESHRFDFTKMTKFERFVLEFTATAVPHYKQNAYIEQYSCRQRPPLFMILISLLEVGCFIYYAVILTNKGCVVDSMNGISTWSPLIYNPRRRYEVWRFLTYALLHIG